MRSERDFTLNKEAAAVCRPDLEIHIGQRRLTTDQTLRSGHDMAAGLCPYVSFG
jgi:hypothetical protein